MIEDFSPDRLPSYLTTLGLMSVDQASGAYKRAPLTSSVAPGLSSSAYKGLRPLLEITAAGLAAWTTRSAGITYSIDTYQGQPAIRMDVAANFAAGAGGLGTLGSNGASIEIPTGWAGDGLVVGFASSDTVNGSEALTVNMGDSGLANFYRTTTGPAYAGYFENSFKYAAGDVVHYHTRGGVWTSNTPMALSWVVGAGAPTFTGTKQITIRPTIKAGNPAFTIWITQFSVERRPRRATAIFTFDDGWSDQYNEVVPRARFWNIPVTLNIVGSLIGTANYMTDAQLRELAADDSGLIELANHTYNHIPFNTRAANVGDTQARADMVADFNTNRDWLVARGVGESALHGAWPQSEYNRQLILDMKAAGYKSMRAGSIASSHKSGTLHLGDRGAWGFGSDTEMQTGVTLANMTDRLALAITERETIWLEGHKFRSAVGANQWTPRLLDDLFAAVATARDVGTVDGLTQSQWFNRNTTNMPVKA